MKSTCVKCGSEGKLHRHHITYEPEKIVILCPHCHSIITSINTLYAKWSGVKLENFEREKLHLFFMQSHLWILEALLGKARSKAIIKKVRTKMWGNPKKKKELKHTQKQAKALVERFGRNALHGVWDEQMAIPSEVKIIRSE